MSRRAFVMVIVIAIAAAAGLVIFAIVNPLAALRGWLAAFVWVGMIPIGCLTLVLTHRITGGDWGFALAPVLEAGARAVAVVGLLGLPVVIFSASLYRWQFAPEMPAEVKDLYMNAPFYAARTIGAFCIWSALAWLPSLRSTMGGAACGLIMLGVLTNFIPLDWVEATKPGYHSSAFGFGFWIEQVLAAFALCAFLGTEGDEKRECKDLAGLIIAALLGTMYFVYVQFAIIWYGNLPDKAAWYIIRSKSPWPETAAFAFLIGAAGPFLALLNKEVRESETALHIIGGAMSVAITIHVIWLVVPSFQIVTLLPAVLAFIVIAILSLVWLQRTIGLWAPPWSTIAARLEDNV